MRETATRPVFCFYQAIIIDNARALSRCCLNVRVVGLPSLVVAPDVFVTVGASCGLQLGLCYHLNALRSIWLDRVGTD